MYIRLTELEFLLSNYNNLQGLLQELNLELQNVKEERVGGDDEAYSISVRRNVDNMPVASHRISDRTAAAVIDRYYNARKLRKAAKEIQGEILAIEVILGKIELGLRILNHQFRTVVEGKYLKGQTWKEISYAMKKNTRTLSQYHGKALEKMLSICRISLDDHRKIQKLLLEGGMTIDK